MRIDGLTIIGPEREDLLERVTVCPRSVMYVNAHVFNLASSNARLMRALRSADIVYCDGVGVQLGARILKQQVPNRLTSTDWIDAFADRCAREGRSIFLLGGARGIAERAAQRLVSWHPRLSVVGCHHGYFRKKGLQSMRVVTTVNATRPDFLIVGFGTPTQEFWVHDNRPRLEVPTVWCVGAMMDFVGGVVRRAPLWMRRRKLEWLFRLWLEPERMWRRYLVGNLTFLGRMFRRRWELETIRSERNYHEHRDRLSAA